MITEDYCSYYLSKLFKNIKDFDGICNAAYLSKDIFIPIPNPISYESEIEENMILAPTYQMAMKWLRKRRGMIINIDRFLNLSADYRYRYTITHYDFIYKTNGGGFLSYSDALEQAIRTALTMFLTPKGKWKDR